MVHELAPADQTCPQCGGTLKEMPGQTENSEEITVVERRFVLVKHQRKKYRCACNGCIDTAPGPLRLATRPDARGRRYAPEFAVEVAVNKYVDHLPLERQARVMAREGLIIESQTLWDQIEALATALGPTYEALRRYVLAAPVIGADETWWRLFGGPQRTRWWAWSLTREDAVTYTILDSRSQEAARQVLNGYRGMALQPLLKATPLSRSTVSRIVATLKDDLQAWEKRSLADLDVVYLYLDALVLRVRRDGQVESVPVLAGVAVLADGQKQLLTLDLCRGESYEAWKGCLDDLVARGLKPPLLCIVDGNAGLRRAIGTLWPTAAVQRCCVHKLRNLERKAPKHALAELREDFHRIVYASSVDTARATYTAFTRKWEKRCPAVVKSLHEGGDELLTFFTFPKAQWKTVRTTNVIERLNEEFRRRVKTQSALPTDDAAVTLLFSLVASGQVKLRKLDGWRRLAAVIRQRLRPAA